MDQASVGKLGNKVDETATGRKVAGETGPADARGTGPAGASDTVEVTSSGRLLESLEKSLKDLPAIDEARVAEVRTAIENGNYEIDSEALADAIIRFERGFGE